MLLAKILNRAQVKATVGRDIRVVSSHGDLDLKVTMARELDGTNGRGTNPEQLFAASYVAGFLETMRFVPEREGIAHPTETEVEARIAMGATRRGFGIQVELRIYLPGLPCTEADSLVEKSHAACPYVSISRSDRSVRSM